MRKGCLGRLWILLSQKLELINKIEIIIVINIIFNILISFFFISIKGIPFMILLQSFQSMGFAMISLLNITKPNRFSKSVQMIKIFVQIYSTLCSSRSLNLFEI